MGQSEFPDGHRTLFFTYSRTEVRVRGGETSLNKSYVNELAHGPARRSSDALLRVRP
jgi:hypothetical protein